MTTASYTKFIMDGKVCHIVEYPAGDSSEWDVRPEGKCTFSLKYIKGTGKLSAEQREFFEKHFIQYQVKGSTADYFIVNSYLDRTGVIVSESDTMWLQP